MRLLDLRNGRLGRRFAAVGGEGEDSVIRVSADQRFVVRLARSPVDPPRAEVSCKSDAPDCGELSVYEYATGRRVLGPVVPAFQAGDVALNPDGSLVAVAGGAKGELAVYRTATGQRLGQVPGLPWSDDGEWSNRRDTASVAFGPLGHIYVGSLGGPIRELDASTLRELRRFSAPPMSSQRHLVPSGGVLIGSGSKAIVAVDLRSGKTHRLADLHGDDPDPCPWLAIAPSRLYCGNRYGVIEERDLTTGQRTGATFDPQLGSVGELAVGADGRELVAFGAQVPGVSRWRLDRSGPVTRLVAKGLITTYGYDFRGKALLVANRELTQDPAGGVTRDPTGGATWDPATNRRIAALPKDAEGTDWIDDQTVFSYRRLLKRFEFVDATSGAVVPSGARIQRDLKDTYWEATIEPARVYVGATNKLLTYDAHTRRRIGPTMRVEGSATSISHTRGGERVVVTSDANDGTPRVTRVYDGRTGKPVSPSLRGLEATGVSLDGVLVGASAGDVTQYDLDTLLPVAKYPGARGEVTTLAFSRDGRVLLVGSNDQTVSVYDVATRTRIGDPLPTRSPQTFQGSLRPDGAAVALNTRDGVAVWNIDPAHLAAAACRLAGRNLTRLEWNTYLGDVGSYRKTCP